MGRKRFETFTWRGRKIRRRRLTLAQEKARIQKLRATVAARKAARLAPQLAPPAHETSRAKARREALASFGTASTVPPAHYRRKGNGSAVPREPDVGAAVIKLTRAENWITAARYMGVINELDPAHRETIAALGDLLGLYAP